MSEQIEIGSKMIIDSKIKSGAKITIGQKIIISSKVKTGSQIKNFFEKLKNSTEITINMKNIILISKGSDGAYRVCKSWKSVRCLRHQHRLNWRKFNRTSPAKLMTSIKIFF